MHEAVLLLGLFAAQHPGHQQKLSWGPAPSVLQRLCTIPSLYLEAACPPAPACPATAPPAARPVLRGAPSVQAAPDDTVRPAAAASAAAAAPADGCNAPPGSEVVVAGAAEPEADRDVAVSRSSAGAAAEEGSPGAVRGSAATAAAVPPTYLLHVLFPTLLAACLDAPRNCAAVCECLGPAGVLAYCAAQCPSGCHAAGGSGGGCAPRCSAGGAEAADGRGGVRGGPDAASAAQRDWEWDVDLGPLDGRFHPRHRIARADWARAEAQLRAAAEHTPRSVSDAASGDSGGAAVPGWGVSERHACDGAGSERHLGPGDCVAAGAGVGICKHASAASAECDRMPRGCAIRGGDSHEGPG